MMHLIGILGYNSQPRLDKCAASVLRDMPPDTDLIIADNGEQPLGQPAGAVAYYLRGITGGGFTSALRWFLEHAREAGARTATFLNDDLELEPGCLPAMIAAAQEPCMGLACPMQVDMQNAQMIICGGTGPAYPGGIHKTGPRGIPALSDARDCRWMPFAAVTFSLDAVLDIGLPDSNMRLWFSDSDYCIRTRLAGYRVRYLGSTAVVRHEQSASIKGMDDGARRRQFISDQLAFNRKWGGGILAEYSN